MKLPFSFSFKKKEEKNYYLSLLLRDNKATAVVFEELAGKVKVVGEDETTLDDTVENTNAATLIDVLDKVISSAESSLPDNVETHKTIYGLKADWIQDGKIKKEYLGKLKVVSDTLELDPIGFLVITEAIAHLLQKEEGAPLSALLIEVATTYVAITLLRGGKIIETKQAPIEESATATADTLLKHFSVDVLPSKIILIDATTTIHDTADKHEKLVQTFIRHSWSKGLPFLHVPHITHLPYRFEAKAVLFGAASQMGFEVSPSQHLPLPIQSKREEIPFKESHSKVSEEKEHLVDTAEEKGPETKNKKDADEFGFFEEKDVAVEKPHFVTKKVIEENLQEESEEPKYAIGNVEPGPHHPQPMMHHTPHGSVRVNPLQQFLIQVKSMKIPHLSFATLLALLPTRGGGRSPLLFVPPALIALFLGIFLLYFFAIGATVEVVVSPKELEQTESITFATNDASDLANNVIHAELIEVTEEGSLTTEATGIKETGEKAKGAITLYNSATQEKTIAKNTVLTSSNGLKYILDKDVSISSASGDIFSGTKPGTTQVSVTASTFGSEYNLPSNTKFTVEGSSTTAAKNDNAFSGGSKKEITVVAKKDTDKLLKDLPQELEGKAKEKLQQQAGGDTIILPEFLTVTIGKKSFNNDVGEEAKNVTLTGNVTFQSLAYKESDLTEYTKVLLQSNLRGMVFSKDRLRYEITDITKEKDNNITGKFHVTASLLPDIDQKTVASKITGYSFSSARAEIMKLPQVQDIQIKLRPNLPLLPSYLPRRADNITITVKTNG